jgi:hypothetical protein
MQRAGCLESEEARSSQFSRSLRAWQDMLLFGSPRALEAVSRCGLRMPLPNPISTERLLFKLRPDHSADERVETVAELTQSALDSLGLKPGMIKPL